MRRLLIILAIPLVLLVLAAILVPLLLDKERILALAAEELEKQTGAILQVDGEVGLSIFPTLGVALEQASITLPAEQQTSLEARALQIGVQFMPLLSKEVEIDTIALDGVVVKTVSAPAQETVDTSNMSNEELDAMYAARNEAREAAGEAAGGQVMLTAPLALNVQTLSITDSRVEIADAESGELQVVELRKLAASGLNLDGRAIPLEMALAIPGEAPLEVDLGGEITVQGDGQTLTLAGLEVEVRGALASPVQLEANGDVNVASQVAELDVAIDIGETRGEGKLRYGSFESPQIDARMAFNLFNPALLALAGPDAAAQADSGTGDGAASGDEPLPLDAIRAIDTRARLTIERAVFDAHTIHDLKVNLRARDGVVRLSSLTGTLHGGQLDMKANLNGKHNVAILATQGSLAGLDIATALAALESEPLMTGSTDLSWKLNARGTTVNELIGALNGPIELQGNDAVLKNLGVEKMLCDAVALVNQEALSAQFPESTSFQSLVVDVQLVKGEARLKPLLAALPGIKLTGTGKLDLLSQDFDTTFKARLSQELAQVDPACRINERYTAIDWPVSCEGNVAGNPDDWCQVDTRDIIEDMASEEIKRKATREVERKFGEEAGELLDSLFK